MDVEMFKFSEWEIEFNVTDAKFVTRNAHDTTQSLKVLRIFDFDSSIAMMSVLVRDDTNDRYILFSKGSPERIAQKSRHWPEGCSLQLNDLTHKGYRVLALTSKNIDDINLNR
jgi:magnesium-transporting ATPase (P-type)